MTTWLARNPFVSNRRVPATMWAFSAALALLAACGESTTGSDPGQGTADTSTDSSTLADGVGTTDTLTGETGPTTDTAVGGSDAPEATGDVAAEVISPPDVAPEASDDVAAEVAIEDQATAPETAPPADTAAETDTAVAPVDAEDVAAVDVNAETSVDDAAPDTVPDTQPDTVADTAADAGAETAQDIAAEATAACPGSVGCACKEAKDCTSGECGLNLAASLVCIAVCGANDSCAAGFGCAKGAGKALCLEQDIALCAPCLSNDQCSQPSAAGKAGSCVSFAEQGAFCGFACLLNFDCPDGYSCADGADIAGTKGKYCKPKDSGTCKCSPVAIFTSASTICSNGACKAQRKCTVTGLTACTASTPTVETCDGIDNDCDGATDGSGLCDDKSTCTSDVCSGAAGCKSTALADGATCTDGDSCTTDSCKTGKCVGVVASCDDKNPCTTDSCDAKGGCTNVADDAGLCSDGDPCTKDLCKAGKCASDNGACDDASVCTVDSCDKAKGCVNTAKPASDCDDKDSCSTDSCDPIKGCQSAKIVNCNPSVVYQTDFACGTNDWQLDPGPAASNAKWAIDGDPLPPGPKSAACALNFNNGKDFTCLPAETIGIPKTYATSPLIDASAVKVGAPVKLKFWLGGQWEMGGYDNLVIELSTNGGSTWAQLIDLDPQTATTAYSPVIVPVPDAAGKKLKLRFVWFTVDCLYNDTVGPFIDDLVVFDATCKADKDCNDEDPCTTDSCDVASGNCAAKVNANPCDDGNLCTTGDACNTGGKCAGTATVCDDKNSCTSDACDVTTGKCGAKPVNDGSSCNDAEPCTKLDHCEAATCVGQPQCDDGNPCTDDSCTVNLNEPVCAYPVKPDASPCSDGDACTAGDVCAGNKCAGTAGPCSVAWSLANDCTQAQLWTVSPLPASSTDVAWNLDASPLPPGYKSASCSLNFNNGTNFVCPTTAVKVAGAATLGTVIDLTKAKAATLRLWSYAQVGTDNYTDQRWVELSGDDFKTIALKWKLDNASAQLNGWKLLNFDLTAVAGKAVKLRVRFDSLNCSTNTGTGWFVDDLLVVTDVAKGCANDGECGDSNTCTDDTCNTGKCMYVFNKILCDDGSKCTTGDVCNGAGGCLGPTATNCNDNAACTIDSCDPVVGCQYKNNNNGFVCGDSNNCTIDDTCDSGKCVGKPKCDDKNPCTTDSCVATSGACTNAALADGVACSDTDPCTGPDACKAGKCSGNPAACSSLPMDKFNCNQKDWAVPPPAAPTPAQWAIDGSPTNPGFFSPLCSLNFNNGQSFACPATATKVEGAAVSTKTWDLLAAKAATLKLMSWAATGVSDATDLRYVEASADDFKTVPVSVLLDNDSTNNQWKPVVIDLTPLAGKIIKLRFRFDSVNCDANTGSGWFVDDAVIWTDVALGCETDANCGDGDACTKDTCTSNKCTYAPLASGACEDGNPCTLTDSCVAGVCKAGPSKICNDNNGCTSDSCQPASGCVYTAMGDGAFCSDNNGCTTGDVCTAGLCGGAKAPDGGSCSDNDACTVGDSCTGGKCMPKAGAVDGTTCTTADGCSVNGKCAAGQCAGSNACDDANPCTVDACTPNGPTGKICASTAAVEGSTCSDNDTCTAGQTCQAGACKGGTNACTALATWPMDCGTTGWTFSAASSGSVWAFDATPNPPGFKSASCSLNFNNGTDFAGVVKGTADSPAVAITSAVVLKFWTYSDTESGSTYDKKFVEISTDNFVSTALSVQIVPPTQKVWYQPASIALSNFAGKSIKVRFRFDSVDSSLNATAGWFVDDAVISTVGSAGCAQDSECPSDNNPCTVEKCADTKCSSAPINGNLCDDADVCSQASACVAGTCTGGNPIACDDGDKCTVDSCDAKTSCKYTYTNGCSEVKLPYTNKFDCGDPLAAWLLKNDSAGPMWKVDAKPNPPGFLSAGCSLNFNNDIDFQCPTGATTVGGTALSPVFDATDYKGAKLHVKFQYSGAWENGSADNLDIVVLPVNSTATALSATYDGANYWKVVTLDATKFIGQRFRLSFSFKTLDCVGNLTTGAFIENLFVGDASCKADVDCDDGNGCSTDVCNVATGACTNGANTAICDDKNACTAGDKCLNFVCGGSAKVCDDKNDCTADSCVPASGDCTATVKADNSICSDGNDCTTSEACNAGKCQGGLAKADTVVCTDSSACTTGDNCQGGSCKPTGKASDGITCTDNNPCTTADVCTSGVCAGPAPSCDDKNSCTVDSCTANGTQAVCAYPQAKDGAVCDDGAPCTSDDVCAGGVCKGPTLICKYGYSESFSACGATAGWTLDPVGANGVGWAFDGTPAAPGALSPPCSLNINNGINYAGTGGTSAGKALSPEIDLTGAATAILTYWSFSGVEETYEDRIMEVMQGTTILASQKQTLGADDNKWISVTVDLKAHVGKKIKLRFTFNTKDSIANNGPGWFIDDIKLQTGLPPSVFKVTTSGFTFTPTPLTIAVNDMVEFTLPGSHNVVEVAGSDWDNNDPIAMPTGFAVGFGQTKKVAFAKAGTYYYMCEPHGAFGMKGQIIVK